MMIVLISVFGVSETKTKSKDKLMYAYSLEIVQGNQKIKVGESKVGNLYKNMVVEYEVQLGGYNVATTIQVGAVGAD